MTAKVIALTSVTMIAFAANSLLARAALGEGNIDAASFAVIRVLSGAFALSLIVAATPSDSSAARGDWLGALWLFIYMICFAFAYLSLSAGTGALILFGAVQITMFAAGLRAGESFGPVGWLGLSLAGGGLAYLVSPGVTAPPLTGASLMTIAGIGWGLYSLRGRGVSNPLRATAANFVRAAPLASVAGLPFLGQVHLSVPGVVLAVTSGAIASGMGYAIWYATLPRLKATSAATIQLSVPVIAAFGGVAFLAERITMRLLVASIAVLGGIALVLTHRAPKQAAAAATAVPDRDDA
ncbi:MAG: DMT family transporter [Chromatiaceae bacterium]